MDDIVDEEYFRGRSHNDGAVRGCVSASAVPSASESTIYQNTNPSTHEATLVQRGMGGVGFGSDCGADLVSEKFFQEMSGVNACATESEPYVVDAFLSFT